MTSESQAFYEREYQRDIYSNVQDAESHSFYPVLKAFIERYDLHNKKCLEVGCGRGAFQDMVTDYTGVDLSSTAGKYLYMPFSQASATRLPFQDGTFDAIFSYAVLEHVEEPENALEEIRRVLKPDGLLLLAPAWQCRSWAADGYPVRPYSDFNWKGKFVKASIPIRNSVLFRALSTFPIRIIRTLEYLRFRRPTRFRNRLLKPNFEHFWMSDSDAINSMDPYEAILWFHSRGDVCLSHPNLLSRFMIRTGALRFRIHPIKQNY